VSPETYPNSVSVLLPIDPPVILVSTDIMPKRVRDLAYAIDNPGGGYKVPNLIGLYVSAPYLHDGGVAASAEALQQETDGHYTVAKPEQMGLAGTWMQTIAPDPAASLRALVDRTLRQTAIWANRANGNLQATQVDGSGHKYWIDRKAGFIAQDQTDLIQCLLSIDDNPEVLPQSASERAFY